MLNEHTEPITFHIISDLSIIYIRSLYLLFAIQYQYLFHENFSMGKATVPSVSRLYFSTVCILLGLKRTFRRTRNHCNSLIF